MRIGIDCREIKYPITGTARFLLTFFEGLSMVEENKELELILIGNQLTNFKLLPSFYNKYEKVVTRESITFYFDQVLFDKVAKEKKIDLLFSPYYKISLISTIPAIITIHDIIYILFARNFIQKSIYKFLTKLYAERATKILCVSEHTRNDVVKHLHVEKDKIYVIYEGISRNFYKREDTEVEKIMRKYKIQRRYILYVGNFNPHKNVSRLILAYNILPERIKEEYQLVIAGGDIRRVMGLIKQLNIEKQISILNHIPEEDLPLLYSGAELFVFPSLYEGFGLPPLEAMSCECPVVSSNASCMPEVLGDACVYFNPYDVEEIAGKIELVLENSSLREELKNKGVERVKLYKPEYFAKNVLQLFYSVI
jgi:glycosyltransferase involved in cell wall biosynthesis